MREWDLRVRDLDVRVMQHDLFPYLFQDSSSTSSASKSDVRCSG